jgi:hypothetical protein
MRHSTTSPTRRGVQLPSPILGALPPASRGARLLALSGAARGHCLPAGSRSSRRRQALSRHFLQAPPGYYLRRTPHVDDPPFSQAIRRSCDVLKTHVASVYFKCFRCFRGMLQVFQMGVAKVDQNVAYVAIVVHVCCKGLFPIFHLCFRTYCCKCV